MPYSSQTMFGVRPKEFFSDVPDCCDLLWYDNIRHTTDKFFCTRYSEYVAQDEYRRFCLNHYSHYECIGETNKKRKEDVISAEKERIASLLAPFDENIKKNPNDAKVYIDRANVYIGLKDINSAIRDFKTASDKDPYNIKLWHKIGSLYLDLKDYNNALSAYKTAFNIDKNDKEAYLKCGQLFFLLEKYDESMNEYEFALQIDPDCVAAKKGYKKSLERKNEIIKNESEAIEEKMRKKEEEYRLIVRNFRDTIYLSLLFSAIGGAAFWGFSFIPTIFIILSILGFIISIFVISDNIKGCALMFLCMLGFLIFLIVCITLLFSDKIAFVITGAAIGMLITLIVNKKELKDFMKYEK